MNWKEKKSVLSIKKGQIIYFFAISLCFFVFGDVFLLQAAPEPLRLAFSKRKIARNETFQITVYVHGFTTKYPPEFPEISGFDKGELVIRQPRHPGEEQVFTQHYLPTAPGIFMLRIFRMSVGKHQVHTPASLTITVEDRQDKPTQAIPDGIPDKPSPPAIPAFSTQGSGAALVLQASHERVFVGQELELNLFLYLDAETQHTIEFPENLYSQISQVADQLHPSSCWEERFGIERPEMERIRLRGQDYVRYRLYRVLLYPMAQQPLAFPSVQMDMLKIDLNQDYNRWRITPRLPLPLRTNPLRVHVDELPLHPLREQVAVGNFSLKEGISTFSTQTGSPISYNFGIEGYGNLRTARLPEPRPNDGLDVYPPKIEEFSYRQREGIHRTKQGRYQFVAKSPGFYRTQDLFRWVYFNTRHHRYDTLRGSLQFFAEGATLDTPLSDLMDAEQEERWPNVDNRLRNLDPENYPDWIVNFFLVACMLVALWLLYKRKRS